MSSSARFVFNYCLQLRFTFPGTYVCSVRKRCCILLSFSLNVLLRVNTHRLMWSALSPPYPLRHVSFRTVLPWRSSSLCSALLFIAAAYHRRLIVILTKHSFQLRLFSVKYFSWIDRMKTQICGKNRNNWWHIWSSDYQAYHARLTFAYLPSTFSACLSHGGMYQLSVSAVASERLGVVH